MPTPSGHRRQRDGAIVDAVRPHAASWLHIAHAALAVTVVCLLAAGCAGPDFTRDPVAAFKLVRGVVSTANEMKTVSDIKQSFIFRASELLFPDKVTTSAEALPMLSAEEQEQVSVFLAGRVEDLYRLSNLVAHRHEVYRDELQATPRFHRIRFLVTGKPEAVVDSDGVVFIDVRTVQALLRSVIIQWQKDGGIEGSENVWSLLVGFSRPDVGPETPRLSATEEAKAINQFNAYRELVRRAPPAAELGFWYRMLMQSPDKHDMEQAFGKGFLNAAADRAFAAFNQQVREMSMLAAARHAQELFESSIDFLIAHELAHQAFGHPQTRAARDGEAPDAATCTRWQEQELVADEFASMVLVQRQFGESRAWTIKETSNGVEKKGDGFVPSVDGRLLVLSTAYQIAGFTDVLVQAPCRYPTTSVRMAQVDAIFKVAEAGLSAGLYLEGVNRGDWLRSKDDTRLKLVVEAIDEAARDVRGQPAPKVARYRAMVSTVGRDRFTGKV